MASALESPYPLQAALLSIASVDQARQNESKPHFTSVSQHLQAIKALVYPLQAMPLLSIVGSNGASAEQAEASPQRVHHSLDLSTLAQLSWVASVTPPTQGLPFADRAVAEHSGQQWQLC